MSRVPIRCAAPTRAAQLRAVFPEAIRARVPRKRIRTIREFKGIKKDLTSDSFRQTEISLTLCGCESKGE
jgi:hypothetical protein